MGARCHERASRDIPPQELKQAIGGDWSISVNVGDYAVSHRLRAIEGMLGMLLPLLDGHLALWHLVRRADGMRVKVQTVTAPPASWPFTLRSRTLDGNVKTGWPQVDNRR